MATVMISKGLINEVTSAVSLLYSEALQEANKVPPHWFDTIYNLLLPADIQKKMSELPPLFFRYAPSVSVFTNSYGVICLENKQRLLLPWSLDSNISGLMHSTSIIQSLQLNEQDPRWSSFLREAKERNDKIASVRLQTSEAVNNARELLNQFGSLGPALKAWPPLWDLLSENTKNRHKQKVVIKKKKEVNLPDNMDDLTTKLTVNRMTQE